MVEGADSEIVWANIFDSEAKDVEFTPQKNVVMYSKQCPRIKTTLELSFVNEQWLVRCSDSKAIWIPSDEFLKTLSNNGTI